MKVKEVADLFSTATNKLDFYWNFYVVFLVALIGWFVAQSNEDAMSWLIKLAITIGYLAFSLVNALSLYGSYTFAEALRRDLVAMPGTGELKHTLEVMQAFSYIPRRRLALFIHLVVDLAILAVIWLSIGTDWGSISGASG